MLHRQKKKKLTLFTIYQSLSFIALFLTIISSRNHVIFNETKTLKYLMELFPHSQSGSMHLKETFAVAWTSSNLEVLISRYDCLCYSRHNLFKKQQFLMPFMDFWNIGSYSFWIKCVYSCLCVQTRLLLLLLLLFAMFWNEKSKFIVF